MPDTPFDHADNSIITDMARPKRTHANSIFPWQSNFPWLYSVPDEEDLQKYTPGQLLRVFEQRLISVLNSFTEVKSEVDGAHRIRVRGKWRWFTAGVKKQASSKADDQLLRIALAFDWLAQAFVAEAEARDAFCDTDGERAILFAHAAMLAAHYSTEAGITTSEIWKYGEKAFGDRRRGGISTKLLTSDKDVFRLKSAYTKHRSKKAWLQAIVDELRTHHKINVSRKTVSRRLRELGLP